MSDELMHTRMVNAILEHRLPPGTRLAEDRLAQIFGVSRTRIRPVLTRLAHDRLIVLRPPQPGSRQPNANRCLGSV